ncbi:gluconolactonase [Nannochloropsis oceanica]
MTDASNFNPRLVVDAKNILGEGPVWDDRRQALLWIDIEGKTLHTYAPAGGKTATYPLPMRPCSFALREAGEGLLFAFEDGFAVYDPFVADLSISTPPKYLSASDYVEGHSYHRHGQVRLNDGRCDRHGRFIAGGYNGDEGDAEAGREWECICGVYVVETQASTTGKREAAGEKKETKMVAREMFPFKVRCANSTAFSPDGSVMYFADSPNREIWAFDYDWKAGRVKAESKRVFATIPSPGVPDGSCVDSEGFVWNAEFFSGRVVRYSPEGNVDRVLQLPVSRVTCPCLGGADLKTMYMTCASAGIERGTEEGSGGLWALEVETPGLPEARFRG